LYPLAVFRISFTICLIAAVAVLASGCGSTKKATTATTATTGTIASTSTGATATAGVPAGKGAQKPAQSTGATHAPHATAPEARPEHREAPVKTTPEQQRILKRRAESVKPGAGSGELTPPHHYPKFIEFSFMSSCEAAKGSRSKCECILIKQEKSNVEKGQSIAELVALEVAFKEGASLEKAMHHGVPLPVRIKRAAEQCGR
jgi:hypothetical protein